MFAETHPQLSRVEWAAVSLALVEADTCDCAIAPRPGSLRFHAGRIIALLTGIERRIQLANPRLETIRQFVCETRRRRRAADEYIPQLLEHGFNEAQVEALALLSG